MASHTFIEVNDPHIHIRKDAQDGHECRLVDITMEDGNMVTFHFSDLAAVNAFIGLLTMTRPE